MNGPIQKLLARGTSRAMPAFHRRSRFGLSFRGPIQCSWILLALTLAASTATPALAVQLSAVSLRPARMHPATRVPYRAGHIGPHAFFGTIVAIRATQLVVKLRNGHLQIVDDAQVLADDDYSVPLFVGKLVSIDGTFVRGVFTAQHIFRVTSLDDLQNDH